jgi:hypothetical protein
MPLSATEAADRAQQLYEMQTTERAELDVLRRYWTGRQRLPAVIPSDAPAEIKEMARKARVNVIDIVVNSLTQALFVDGFRAPQPERPGDPDSPLADMSLPVWQVWQLNRMDRGQSGLHRAAVAYGTAYLAITPGETFPVMRPCSPRLLTAVYGADPDWPRFALEKRPAAGDWRLYDGEAVYPVGRTDAGGWQVGEPIIHGLGYCPVVRYRDAEDLDLDDDAEPDNLRGFGTNETRLVAGQVAPLIPLQDQINLTSFTLKAAEWYSAFRQRWAIGWTPASASQKMEAAASQFWTFDEDPAQMQLGEFGQTDLRGYLDSREAALKYAATLSQTPVHELVGAMVNLSAEALAAAEAGKDRKVDERETGMGESHEQAFQAVGALMGVPIPADSQVVWRDTSARAFAATVDGLGKLVQMLGIPPEELLDRVPGLTQQDVRRIRAKMAEGDSLANLTGLLDRQAAGLGGDGGPDR